MVPEVGFSRFNVSAKSRPFCFHVSLGKLFLYSLDLFSSKVKIFLIPDVLWDHRIPAKWRTSAA